MSKLRWIAVALAALVALVFIVVLRVMEFGGAPSSEPGPVAQEQALETGPVDTAAPVRDAAPSPRSDQGPDAGTRGFLYGRVTLNDDSVVEGRLRWGGNEEAFWGDLFNGIKSENPWVNYLTDEQRIERRPLEVFGRRLAVREVEIDFERPFMSRFGDMARVERLSRTQLGVTLKSGTFVVLDRMKVDDLNDGIRVWDRSRGVVDVPERKIRLVEFLPAAQIEEAPARLFGTVRTGSGDFTGFVQWNRRMCTVLDPLIGETTDGEVSIPWGSIRAVTRISRGTLGVTLDDGSEVRLTGDRVAGPRHRGVFVDDLRYGRVLIAWGSFSRIDFGPAPHSGPSYADFPPGGPLRGSVTTRAGRRLEGRIVFDLDENETTDTLDAPWEGVNYVLPFGLVAELALPDPGSDDHPVRATLHSGGTLLLHQAGDLGEGNAGLLVFSGDSALPEYVAWSEVRRHRAGPARGHLPIARARSLVSVHWLHAFVRASAIGLH